MRVIVCGKRNYSDSSYFVHIMDKMHKAYQITEVIQGGAAGADCMAVAWGLLNDIKVTTCKADWKKYGKAAGPIRNKEMLDLKPDMVIGFPGGRGTRNMLDQAQQAGIKTFALKGRE